MPVTFDNAFGIHEKALLLKAQRSEVLSSNIANADKPHYKARDIEFKAALNQAHQVQRSLSLEDTNTQHLSAPAPSHSAGLLYRVPEPPSLDGNTVDSRTEQAEFAENALQYQASLTMLNARISGIRNAIRGE